MKLYDFLVSKQQPVRYYRHIAFWGIRFLYLLQSVFGVMYFFHHLSIVESLNSALAYAFYVAFAEMAFTYTIVYWLIPKFFRTRRFLFATGVIILAALLVIIESPVYIHWFQLESLPKNSLVLIIECIIVTTATSHFICILFIACVLFKNYYLTMKEHEVLIAENASAEIQLLKAQVHPHFLFNTLNNIYSFSLKNSSTSGDLVLKLSDTLKYIVNECDTPLVPVQKELKFIKDYIGLEKVRYGDRLEMQFETNGDFQNKYIAPLLLIPFVENSFKHGASKSLKYPWIKIEITFKEELLIMNLCNSAPLESQSPERRNGIGLSNVQKRLQLLYPDTHKLRVEPSEGKFCILLEVPLQVESNQKTRRPNPESVLANFQNSSYG